MALDTTTYVNGLKHYYTPGKMEELVYKDNAGFAMEPKSSKLPGDYVVVPIWYADSQNRSATFANALSGTSNLAIGTFNVVPANDYGIAVVGGEVIRASASDDGAFIRALTGATNAVIRGLKRSWSQKLYRSGFGDIGKIDGTTPAGTTFTLANIAEIASFEVNQRLVFASAQSATTLRNTGGTTTLTVSAVNRVTGVVTCSTTITTVTGLAASDFIFNLGDRYDSAVSTRICVTGKEGWVPTAAPTSTAFFGLDRSVDPTRLGGLRQDSRGQNLEEALIDAAELVGREGWGLSHFMMNFTWYGRLIKLLGSKVQYVNIETDMPDVGFTGVRVIGPRGNITIVPDQNVPTANIYGETLDTWLLRSRGEPIGPLNDDGLDMVRSANADAYELRYGGYGNDLTSAPGANINLQMA